MTLREQFIRQAEEYIIKADEERYEEAALTLQKAKVYAILATILPAEKCNCVHVPGCPALSGG